MRLFLVLLGFVFVVLGFAGCSHQEFADPWPQEQVLSTGHAVNLADPVQDDRAWPHW